MGKTNIIFERYKFNQCSQGHDESFDSYVIKLRKLAATCEYNEMTDDMIRDRIVGGIVDNQIRKALLQESKLTLASCISIVQSAEATASQASTMAQASATNRPLDVNAVKSKRQPKFYAQGKSVDKPMTDDCKFCGRAHVLEKFKCPVFGKTCRPKSHNVKNVETDSDSDSDQTSCYDYEEEECSVIDLYDHIEINVNHVNTDKASKTEKYATKILAMLQVQDALFVTQVDCGASCNVLPDTYLPAGTVLVKSDKKLRMYNKQIVPVLGTCKLHVKNPKNDKRYLIPFYVVRAERSQLPLIGSRTGQQMRLITVNYENIAKPAEFGDIATAVSTSESSDIIREFDDVFTGRGRMPGQVNLQVDPNIQPVIMRPRRVPIAVQPKLKTELERLEHEGVIEKVDEPTDWCSSLVCVQKPNGNLRLCIDPQPLNVALKRPRFALPVIEDVLPDLDGVRVFSKADLSEGFLQCELDEPSSLLTTFHTPWGRYKYRRMPFGISPAPEIFQQKLNQCLEGLRGIHIIADDVLITGRGDTLDAANHDHDVNMRAFLERCRKMNITLNKDKLEYKCESLRFIGHILTTDGLKSDPSKVNAVLNMPKPTDIAGIQRLLGMVKYLAKFIPNLSVN